MMTLGVGNIVAPGVGNMMALITHQGGEYRGPRHRSGDSPVLHVIRPIPSGFARQQQSSGKSETAKTWWR